MGIPKKIHQIWIQGEEHFKKVRPRMHAHTQTTLTFFPEWEYHMWNEEEILALIREHCPEYIPLYDAAPNNAFKADLGREIILLVHGGAYMDTDYAVIRDMRFLLDGDLHAVVVRCDNFNKTEKVVARFRYNICFVASAPGSPLVKDWIEEVKTCQPYESGSTMDYTIATSLSTFDRVCTRYELDDNVRVVSNALLEPVTMNNLHRSCDSVETCKKEFPSAYGVHMNEGSWIDGADAARMFGVAYGEASEYWFVILIGALLVIIGISIAVHYYKRKYYNCSSSKKVKAMEMYY